MNWPFAFMIVGALAVFCAAGISTDRQRSAIAVACVSSGGEWKKPSWYADTGCFR